MPTLSVEQTRAASDLLTAHWRDGTTLSAIPETLRPHSRDDGYRIQQCLEHHDPHPVRGWKIAATSAAGQHHINVDGPLAGRLLSQHVLPASREIDLGANRMRVAEIEFVFVMARTLAPRTVAYTRAEVMAAVARLHLGIEIPDSRFTDFTAVGAAQLIADDACADRFVLGPEVPPPDWRDRDLAAHKVQCRTSRGLVHDGAGANALGDPRIALTWLVNELSHHGIALTEDTFVTTGTCVTPIPIAPGDSVTGDYGDFGSMEIHLAAAARRFVPEHAGQ